MSIETAEPDVAEESVSSQPTPRRWRAVLIKTAVAVVALLVVVFAVVQTSQMAIKDSEVNEVLFHTVRRGDFEAFVTESGDIESSSNVEVRCKVKSEGGAATTILDIVEEGQLVYQGDFLVQFDDSRLKLAHTQQEILVATDEKAVIDAESELEKARQTLNEYREGLFLVEKETFEGELLQAESALKTAQDSLEHSERLFRKGYVSRLQMEAQQAAVEQATKNVKVAQTRLRVHVDFTYDRMVKEYEAEIKKQEASLKAANYTLQLSEQRRDEIGEQIKLCRVLAPATGQVVYANDFERRQNIVIEEGAQIREGQVVIRLPNPKEMHVRARINDSKIKKVKVNNSVMIELDVNPNLPVKGVVAKVNPFPYPREWYGGPIEYGVEIKILDPPAELTPGQRAKARIFVERLEDVVQVPIQSVVERDGAHFCVVRNADGDWHAQPVDIGANNGSFVVLNSGIQAGDKVVLTPDQLWDDMNDTKKSKPSTATAESPKRDQQT